MEEIPKSIDRDRELTQVFDDENKGKERSKDAARKKAKQNAFLNELIRIVLKDEGGNIIPGCDWLLTRKKMTGKTLRDLIKRSPMPHVDPDYFYDDSGTAFWVEDLMLRGNTLPSFYSIVPKVRRIPFDIRKDPKYEGQTMLMITNVPVKAKDEMTVVGVDSLREYIIFAVMEEDPYSKPFVDDVERLKELIKEIDKKIKFVSKMEFLTEDGGKMSVQRAEAEREILYNAYGEERVAAEHRLKARQQNYAAHLGWRRKMGIEFTLGEIDENTETATWYIRLFGTEDFLEMEDLLAAKDDWAGIKLCCSCDAVTPPSPPWVGRGPIPDGSKSFLPDYTPFQVNVAGARVARVPHGVGSFKSLDRQSSSIASDQFGVYYGNWEGGKKNGHGIEFSDVGVYAGRFVTGLKDGHGRFDLADGTTVVGNFGYNMQYEEKFPMIFENPYCEGEPNGPVEILFSDGGFFRGIMKDGRINGQGEYQSAFGELLIGNFKDGVLDGPDGYHLNAAKEKFKGSWNHGELLGFGKYENERGDTFEGMWDHSMRHGKGRATYKNRGMYIGYYVNDTMTGKAELHYGKIKKNKKKSKTQTSQSETANADNTPGKDELPPEMKTKEDDEFGEEPEPEFRNIYQGYLIANSITTGGIIMDAVHKMPTVVSRRDKRTVYPINSLIKKVGKTAKTLKRTLEKNLDMEHYMRNEITKKKSIIFRQQKHFTKKSMYAEDTYGGIKKADFEAREKVRKGRLDSVSEEKLVFKKAMVPHLKKMSQEPVTHLTKVFNMIRPEPEHGDVKKVKKLMIKLAISDFEEARERQRFLKYDNIFQRAEHAFVKKKTGGSAE